MTPKQAIGKIVSFDYDTQWKLDQEKTVVPTKKCVFGEVIDAMQIANTDRGNIPNMTLTVRGRSGKVAFVDMVEQHAHFFETWEEALKP